jgi:hypothetical protein
LLAVICAIAVILVSLPTDAGIGDKGVPPVGGEKTKLLYTVVGVRDSTTLATLFHCTSTDRSGGPVIRIGVEVFNYDTTLKNDVTAGDGDDVIVPGGSVTFGTQDTASFEEDEVIGTGTVNQGSARIFATSKNVLCSAMIVEVANDPPTSMGMLPVFKATKQGGM